MVPAAVPCRRHVGEGAVKNNETAFTACGPDEYWNKPFPASHVTADNNALFEALNTGVVQGMNSFTLCWAGKIPATILLGSCLVALDQPPSGTLFSTLRACPA